MSRVSRADTKPAASTTAIERNTRQRRKIREVFAGADRPLSIEEVLAAARRGRCAVSLSTVYRFVRLLVDEGTLAVFELPGQGPFYELTGKAHHHHFSCSRCGRVYDLNDCVSIEKLALPAGFQTLSHDLTVAGICAACIAASASGGLRAVRGARSRPRP